MAKRLTSDRAPRLNGSFSVPVQKYFERNGFTSANTTTISVRHHKTSVRAETLARLSEAARMMCQECAGTGLQSYHATRVTDTCNVCGGSGKAT